jgi:hypothetical protein
VTDDNATKGGRQNGRWPEVADPLRDAHSARLGFSGMLKHESTLQVPGTVQPGRQPEMAFEERPDTPEQIENVFSSSGRHDGEYTFCKQANLRREGIVLQPVTPERYS